MQILLGNKKYACNLYYHSQYNIYMTSLEWVCAVILSDYPDNVSRDGTKLDQSKA